MLVLISNTRVFRQQNLQDLGRGFNTSFKKQILVKAADAYSNPRDQSLPGQPISTRKAQSRKNAHKPLRISLNIVISTIDWPNQRSFGQTFHMFSLLDLRFMLCSHDLNELHVQRITLYDHYPQINEVRNSDDVEVNAMHWCVVRIHGKVIKKKIRFSFFINWLVNQVKSA